MLSVCAWECADVCSHPAVYSAKRLLSSAVVFETTCPPPSIPKPNLPSPHAVKRKKKSIFRKSKEHFFPSSFISLHLWAHFSKCLLNGPFSSEIFRSPPFFLLCMCFNCEDLQWGAVVEEEQTGLSGKAEGIWA